MKVEAYQESGLEAAVIRRKEGRDSVTVDFILDSDLNIVSASSITKGFYIGGDERGNDVRVTLSRSDLIELINVLDEKEADKSGSMNWKRESLKDIRNRKIVDDHFRQIQLAKRRKRYADKKKKSANFRKLT